MQKAEMNRRTALFLLLLTLISLNCFGGRNVAGLYFEPNSGCRLDLQANNTYVFYVPATCMSDERTETGKYDVRADTIVIMAARSEFTLQNYRILLSRTSNIDKLEFSYKDLIWSYVKVKEHGPHTPESLLDQKKTIKPVQLQFSRGRKH